MTMWMVRAERGGVLSDHFSDEKLVSIGWLKSASVADAPDRDAIRSMILREAPSTGAIAASVGAGMLWRFGHEIKKGDRIVTYDSPNRTYLIGTVDGPYRFDADHRDLPGGHDHPHVLPVRWEDEVPRDALSQAARNTLGSTLTLFRIPQKVANEITSGGVASSGTSAAIDDDGEDAAELFVDSDAVPLSKLSPPSADALHEQATTAIGDMISAISPDDMEEFVAGLLRALGYHARVSPKGPDRGRDILATPDPLGLEDPRIHVEVKHRAGKASPGMIRSFLGGRGPGDRGIFVSTGGFTREARYEADRASIPVQLLDIEDLVRLLIENYSKLNPEIARMIPLRRIWWPH